MDGNLSIAFPSPPSPVGLQVGLPEDTGMIPDGITQQFPALLAHLPSGKR